MDNGGLSASDVALLDGGGLNGGNSFMWIFGLLILMSMFNGGFGGNNFANAIGFNMAKHSEEIDDGTELSLYGTLSWNNFNGKRSPQIEFIGIEKQTA